MRLQEMVHAQRRSGGAADTLDALTIGGKKRIRCERGGGRMFGRVADTAEEERQQASQSPSFRTICSRS